MFKENIKNVAEIEVSYIPNQRKNTHIITSKQAYEELINFFPKATISLQEHFVVMYLNRTNLVLGVYQLSKGGITSTVVDIRLIFSVALKIAATQIILAHNHPSGALKPSKADIEITNKIREAGRILDICLIDHLIISPHKEYYSLVDNGL